MTYPPCQVCGAETGLAPNEQCPHICHSCEGTRKELNGWPCLHCNGTGLNLLYRRKLPPVTEIYSLEHKKPIAAGDL
jgi:hypothetical protein